MPVRFRVKYYCAIAWQGHMPHSNLPAAASVARFRDSQVTGRFYVDMTEEPLEKLKELKQFIGLDLMVLYRGSHVLREVNQFCFNNKLPIFANTQLSLEERLEEAIDSASSSTTRKKLIKSAQQMDAAAGTKDEAVYIGRTYQLAASSLFDYEEFYPTWIKHLPQKEERAMARKLKGKEKHLATAYYLLPFGLHYWYLGHPWKSVLYILTLGGCLFWFFLDAFRMPYLLDTYHANLASQCYREIVEQEEQSPHL
jgi:hypothetical protein